MLTHTHPPPSKIVHAAREKISLSPIYLDTETTGISSYDEICEIAILDDDNETLFESFVKPTIPVSPGARAVNRITEEQIATAPSFSDIWPNVLGLLQRRTIAIYNADFDMRLLRQSAARYKFRVPALDTFCVMRLFSAYYGDYNKKTQDYRWKTLEFAGDHFDITLPNSHRALDDCRLTRAVLHHMAGESPLVRSALRSSAE